MKTTCGDSPLSRLWVCTRLAVGSIGVWWDDDRPEQGSGRIDFPHCVLHEPDAEGKAYKLQEDLGSHPDLFNVRIMRFIEGEAREVEPLLLSRPRSSREF